MMNVLENGEPTKKLTKILNEIHHLCFTIE